MAKQEADDGGPARSEESSSAGNAEGQAEAAAREAGEREQASAVRSTYEVPVEVTVAIPTYNSMLSLPHALNALCKQNLPFKLLFADNGSDDGTDLWVGSPAVAGYWRRLSSGAIRDWRVLPRVPHIGSKYENVAKAMSELARRTDTEYIFHLDSNVLLPPGALRDALAELKQATGTGGLGVPFDFRSSHVQSGAVLMRTELARRIVYDVKGCCPCMCIRRSLEERGLELRYWSRNDCGRHLGFELS